eukprot:1230792-Amorphochlora_amoeboformis.AAC.2
MSYYDRESDARAKETAEKEEKEGEGMENRANFLLWVVGDRCGGHGAHVKVYRSPRIEGSQSGLSEIFNLLFGMVLIGRQHVVLLNRM